MGSELSNLERYLLLYEVSAKVPSFIVEIFFFITLVYFSRKIAKGHFFNREACDTWLLLMKTSVFGSR